MAMTKETVLDLVQVTETGAIQVRLATYIVVDGVRDQTIPPSYHRAAFAPGSDVSTQPPLVQAIAAAVNDQKAKKVVVP